MTLHIFAVKTGHFGATVKHPLLATASRVAWWAASGVSMCREASTRGAGAALRASRCACRMALGCVNVTWNDSNSAQPAASHVACERVSTGISPKPFSITHCPKALVLGCSALPKARASPMALHAARCSLAVALRCVHARWPLMTMRRP